MPNGRKHILLVDDYPTVLATLAAILMSRWYRVTTAWDTKTALERFKDGNDFDLVLTDYHMPGETGRELARRIKEIREDIPVVMYAKEKHRLRVIDDENVDASLTWPINHKAMFDQLDVLLGNTEDMILTPAPQTA